MKPHRSRDIRNIFTLLVGAGLLILAACGDDTFRKFRPNPTTLFTDKKPTKVMLLVDSMKNALKKQIINGIYSFTLTPFADGDNSVTYIIYKVEGGTGKLNRGVAIINDTIQVKTPGVLIPLTFQPNATAGEYTLTFTPYNLFKMDGKSTELKLHVFANKWPVARFEVFPVAHDAFSYTLDASKSYDADAAFGGTLKMYEYTIYWNGRLMPIVRGYDTNTGITPIYLPNVGIYTITLKVVDDDGDYSAPVVQTIEVK